MEIVDGHNFDQNAQDFSLVCASGCGQIIMPADYQHRKRCRMFCQEVHFHLVQLLSETIVQNMTKHENWHKCSLCRLILSFVGLPMKITTYNILGSGNSFMITGR